jgi:hypothetical protein
MKRTALNLAVCALATALAPLLAAAAPAAAQPGPMEPITWVILDQLKPGKTGDWASLVKDIYGPVLDQAMAAGQVLSWGLLDRASGGSDFTNAGWVTYPSWEAVAAVDKAIGEKVAAMDPADRDKIGAGFADATEPHRSWSRYLRGIVFEVDPKAPPGRYIMVSDWHAKPGKDQAARALYDEVRPGFAKALADGAISGYGLYVQELHDGGSSHTSWYMVPDLGAIPKVDAALEAVMSEDLSARMADAFDMSAHRDTLWEIRHLGAPPANGGGGGTP